MPKKSGYNLRANRAEVPSAAEEETHQDEWEEWMESGDEVEEVEPAKPKSRRPRVKSTGRHNAAKKFKRTEDPSSIADKSPPPAEWTPAAERSLLRHCRSSMLDRGTLNTEIITANMKVDGFTYSKAQVTNKLGNWRIGGKTIHQVIEADGPLNPAPVSRDSILTEVFSKFNDNAKMQAAYGEKRVGPPTHLQLALKGGLDLDTYTFPSHATVAPVFSSTGQAAPSAPSAPTAPAAMEPAPVSPPSRTVSPSRRAGASVIPINGPLEVTLNNWGRGRLDCLSYVWTLTGTLVLVANVAADDDVTFDFVRGTKTGVKVAIWKSSSAHMRAVVRSTVPWLAQTFAERSTLLAFTNSTPPQVFMVYVPELPFVPGPDEIATVTVDAGRKSVAALINFEDLPPQLDI